MNDNSFPQQLSHYTTKEIVLAVGVLDEVGDGIKEAKAAELLK